MKLILLLMQQDAKLIDTVTTQSLPCVGALQRLTGKLDKISFKKSAYNEKCKRRLTLATLRDRNISRCTLVAKPFALL